MGRIIKGAILIFLVEVSFTAIILPKIKQKTMVIKGDIMIGAITRQTRSKINEPLCQGQVLYDPAVIGMERVRWVLNRVNAGNDLLPNITLGMVALDECDRDVGALAQAVYMVPDETPCVDNRTEFKHHKVAGVIGLSSSRKSLLAASFLGNYHIPAISTYATSDELVDQSRFPFLVRLSPPDSFQTKVILGLIQSFGWNYVSVLYSEGSYGEFGAKILLQRLKKAGICLAVEKKFGSLTTEPELKTELDKINRLHGNAPVVVLILESAHVFMMNQLMYAFPHLHKRFIFIGSDSFHTQSVWLPGDVTVYFKTYTQFEFWNYFGDVTMANYSNNPWLKQLYEKYFDCEWADETRVANKSVCQIDVPFKNSSKFARTIKHNKLTDAAWVFANALHNLISSECPEAFQNKSFLDSCITGDRLLAHLKRVNVTSLNGHEQIQFDENGSGMGNYVINQRQLVDGQMHQVQIGTYSILKDFLDLDIDKVKWGLNGTDKEPPISVCSLPCGKKEYKIPQEQHCCWLCRKCRNNEIIANNATGCEECPRFEWPDDETQTVCHPIPPAYLRYSNWQGLLLALLTAVGVVTVIVVAVLCVQYRQEKLIKASSRELSAIILVGSALCVLTVLPIISTPTDLSCQLGRLGFFVSVCLIYAPIMVKTHRVYYIFSAGVKAMRRPVFISNKFQLIMTACLLLAQIILSAVVMAIYPAEAQLRMPAPTVKHVELLCSLELVGFVIPLAFNLCLIIISALFGFLTRKLPENFNESWYIFVSVTTTLFLWIVFLPAYLTTHSAANQSAIMAACLLLNAFVTVTCLFIPKLYAVRNIKESDMVYRTIGTVSTVAQGSGGKFNFATSNESNGGNSQTTDA